MVDSRREVVVGGVMIVVVIGNNCGGGRRWWRIFAVWWLMMGNGCVGECCDGGWLGHRMVVVGSGCSEFGDQQTTKWSVGREG